MALLIVLLGLGGIFLAGLSWLSLQNLLQARMLFRLGRLEAALPDRPAPAAVRGPIRILMPLGDPDLREFLWYRQTTQVLQGSGRNRSWRNWEDKVSSATFAVEANGRQFRVEEVPTEVQATESESEYLDGRGYLFARNGDRRVRREWLRIPRLVTVVGRLEATPTAVRLVRDSHLGLFVTPHEPRKAAGIELWKGIAGLVVVTAGVILGLWFYYENRWRF